MNVVSRELHFFWLTDYSGSMAGAKIGALNTAIMEAVRAVQAALANHPEVRVRMRAIKFSTQASWHVGPEPVDLERFNWTPLSAAASTNTAGAIRLLCAALQDENMPRRGLPPVIILISDGHANSRTEYEQALAQLKSMSWGRKSVRIAVAVGDESEYDEQQLLLFNSNPEFPLLKAKSVEQLIDQIKWASTAASLASSQSRAVAAGGANVQLPAPPVALMQPSQYGSDVF